MLLDNSDIIRTGEPDYYDNNNTNVPVPDLLADTLQQINAEEEDLGFDPWRESTKALQDLMLFEKEVPNLNNNKINHFVKPQHQHMKLNNNGNGNIISTNTNGIINGNQKVLLNDNEINENNTDAYTPPPPPIPPGFNMFNNSNSNSAIASSVAAPSTSIPSTFINNNLLQNSYMNANATNVTNNLPTINSLLGSHLNNNNNNQYPNNGKLQQNSLNYCKYNLFNIRTYF